MQTPRSHRAGSIRTHPSPEEFESPPPPACCHGRLFLLEYGILIGLQLLCFALDLVIWVVGAYSIVAAFALIFGLHCLVLLPAIFLPLLVERCGIWMKRLKDWGVFHNYDWNIAVSTVTIISTVMALLLVLFCQQLFFEWTHETIVVTPKPAYEHLRKYSIFKFTPSFHVNVTMMGEKISYPVGDPNGSGVYYNCFAPIVLNHMNGPNMFWATCPWQKIPCIESLVESTSCLASWTQPHHSAISWSNDIEYILHDAIKEQGLLWNMPAPPPHFLVVHWENVNDSFRRSFTAWWVTLLTGNLIILCWWIIRRPILRCLCTPNTNPEYALLN